MAKFRAIARKVIEAEQFKDDNSLPPGVKFNDSLGHHVTTMQGWNVCVSVGEWIVKDGKEPGRYYPIDDDEFQRTYEPAPRD